MVFGQLSNRESLRDLIIALEAHQSMCYHLRLGRVNLWPKLHLQQLAKTEITRYSYPKYSRKKVCFSLCLVTFPRAKFCSKKGRIKTHVLYDIEAQVPAFLR